MAVRFDVWFGVGASGPYTVVWRPSSRFACGRVLVRTAFLDAYRTLLSQQRTILQLPSNASALLFLIGTLAQCFRRV